VVLSGYIDALKNEFSRTRDKHAAHRRIVPILQDLAARKEVLPAILARHVARPGVLNSHHYPVVSCDIAHEPHFGLVANCWIPLPNRETDLSTKAIHHHGDMLLTTVTAFGPGYEHWTFTTPELRDGARQLYAMNLIERGPHPLGHVAFVDSGVAHVPFYPKDLTITLALWSSRKQTTWKDRLKRIPVLHRHSSTLRRVGATLGFVRALDLKMVEYFDYSPTPHGFQGIKEREEFPRGPNSDYLHSVFHVIQRTGSEGVSAAIQRQVESGRVQNSSLVGQLLEDLRNGRTIEGRLSAGHYGVPHANFSGASIKQALEAVHSLPMAM
jgi:hypothetical protein